MADRVQLNGQDLDNVVGGKFSFFKDEEGNRKCTVTGHGTFNTTADGSSKYMQLRMTDPNLTEEEIFQKCIAQHIIW